MSKTLLKSPGELVGFLIFKWRVKGLHTNIIMLSTLITDVSNKKQLHLYGHAIFFIILETTSNTVELQKMNWIRNHLWPNSKNNQTYYHFDMLGSKHVNIHVWISDYLDKLNPNWAYLVEFYLYVPYKERSFRWCLKNSGKDLDLCTYVNEVKW